MQEDGRQVIHILFGLALTVAFFLLPRDLFITLLAGVILFGLILMDLVMRGHRVPLISYLLHLYERPGAFPGKGAFFFGISALVTAIIIPGTSAGGGIVVLTLLDGVSALVGTRFGYHRIANGKSLEGTVAGIFAGLFPALILFPPQAAISAVVLSGVIELLLPMDDNLILCPATALMLSLFKGS